jgi:hypothetical protein
MDGQIIKLKRHVKQAAHAHSFVHNDWFVSYHLHIVERIALELCAIYKEADSSIVRALVWIHDYGKLFDLTNQHKATGIFGKPALRSLKFEDSIIDLLIYYVEILDRKGPDLYRAPIEVKIVSSADGASHMVGPFFYFWWRENHTQAIEKLLHENRRKLRISWDKIVLPEVRRAFQSRYDFLREQFGDFPSHFLRETNVQ